MKHIRRMRIGLALAWLTTVPLSPTFAADRRCRERCPAAIEACARQGLREAFCAREVHRLCRRGSTICSVTPTTLPVCVTATTVTTTTTSTSTTTLPPVGWCLDSAGCDVPPSGIVSLLSSAAELRDRLLGVWFDCHDAPGLEPFGGPAAGIEFTADGRWFFLAAESAALVRLTGFGQAGTYEILDVSGMNGPGSFQLDLNLNTGGVAIVQWAFATQPQLLILNDAGVQGALYSHVSGSPSCDGQGFDRWRSPKEDGT